MILVLIYTLLFVLIYKINYITDEYDFYEGKTNYRQILVCFILLFVFFGFRDLNILNDTNHYYQHFYSILSTYHSNIFDIDLDDRFEKGFLVYENIIAKFFSDPYSIIMISAFIVTVLNLFTISRFTNNCALVIYMLMGTTLLSQYSGMRQGLALCITNVAIWQLMLEKYKSFILLTIVAITFHSSAFIILPLIFLKSLDVNRNRIVFVVLASIIIFSSLSTIIAFVGKGESIYLETSMQRETFPLASLMNFFLAFMFLYVSYRKKYESYVEVEPLWWWISIINVVCLFLDIEIQIMARFSNYFYLFSILLWLKIVQGLPDQSKNNSILFVIIVIFAKIVICYTFRPEWNHIYPYSFFDGFGVFRDMDFGY